MSLVSTLPGEAVRTSHHDDGVIIHRGSSKAGPGLGHGGQAGVVAAQEDRKMILRAPNRFGLSVISKTGRTLVPIIAGDLESLRAGASLACS